MAAVAQNTPRENQPFTMNPSFYNVSRQKPPSVYSNGDGTYPSMRQQRSQKFNSEGPIPTSAYASSIYDQQSPQLASNDLQSSQQTPTQQPTPPQSFINPSPTHMKQPSDDRTPEPADTVSRFSNPEIPASPRQTSQLYGSWQTPKPYGQEPPPSRGSISQQPGFQSPGSFGSNNPVNASTPIPMPLSPNTRAIPQSPKYINASLSGTQNPIYAKPQVPREEVCLECTMRDQDMADVDVTSPGAWDRDSDVYYNDLIHSEAEAISNGVPLPEDRPRSTGDMLTVTNLKLWLTMVRVFLIPTNCRPLIIPIQSTESAGTGLAAYEFGDLCQSSEVTPRSRDPRPRSSNARVEATREQNARHLFTTPPFCIRARRF